MDAKTYGDAIIARLTPPRLCDSTMRIAPDAQYRWPPTNSADNPPVGTHLSRAGGLGMALLHEYGSSVHLPRPSDSHDPIANEAGRPNSVIRFKMLHAIDASIS